MERKETVSREGFNEDSTSGVVNVITRLRVVKDVELESCLKNASALFLGSSLSNIDRKFDQSTRSMLE